MKPLILFFASSRYWPKEDELTQSYAALAARFPDAASLLVTDESALAQLPENACAVLVPLSGGVQRLMLEAARRLSFSALYVSYAPENVGEAIAALCLARNAAPALMDCWGVLRREGKTILVRDEAALLRALRVFAAAARIRSAKLLHIGGAEPWVVSNAADDAYQRALGVEIEFVAQDEIAARFRKTSDLEAIPYQAHFTKDARDIIEPCTNTQRLAARMNVALLKTLEAHQADGMALSCFRLLDEGVNCCLGVSYINEKTPCIASCEGDMDSALTMLMVKSLTGCAGFMANPALCAQDTVHFSHCTLPLDVCAAPLSYILRSHHESGIGVSIQAEIPVGLPVTACRYSGVEHALTLSRGVTISGPYRAACRTQTYVRFDDFDRYVDTALGCHQVLAFADIREEMQLLARVLGIKLLG